MPTQTLVALLLRHALTVIGGALVAKGFLEADTAGMLTSDTVVGAVSTLGAVAWSIVQKRATAK